MKESTYKFIKSKVAILLFFTCAFLTNLTFQSFAKKYSVSWFAWVVVASIVALFQTLFIIDLKTKVRSSSKKTKLIIPIVGYIFTTCLTFTGSIFFSVSTVESTSNFNTTVASVASSQISSLNSDIARWTQENLNYQIRIDDYLVKNQVALSKTIQAYKDANEKKINDARAQIVILKANDAARTQGKETLNEDTFEFVASHIPFLRITGRTFKYLILLVLSFVLEFGLFTTMEPLVRNKINIDVSEMKKEMIKYIDSLMDVNGVRLNSDRKIAEVSGISLKNCLKYKEFLMTQQYNGKALLISGKGGTKANFTKEDMIKLATFFINSQKELSE
jgi:hypothetical protein